MPIPLATNPLPLKKLLPGANFATASIGVLSNYTGNNTLNINSVCASLYLQAKSGNTGNIYVCSTSAQPDTTNWANVIAVLTAGSTYNSASITLNNIELKDIFIGADNGVDYAFGAITMH